MMRLRRTSMSIVHVCHVGRPNSCADKVRATRPDVLGDTVLTPLGQLRNGIIGRSNWISEDSRKSIDNHVYILRGFLGR